MAPLIIHSQHDRAYFYMLMYDKVNNSYCVYATSTLVFVLQYVLPMTYSDPGEREVGCRQERERGRGRLRWAGI
jgi:hypothetical protein